MPSEPISPELVLVDPDLGARARAALQTPHPRAAVAAGVPTAWAASTPARGLSEHGEHHDRHYPVWARVTAALWLLVIGILVGGAAIPHAQDKPRLVPKDEDTVVTVCKPASREPQLPEPALPRGHLGGG
jgi:hypothetical protein